MPTGWETLALQVALPAIGALIGAVTALAWMHLSMRFGVVEQRLAEFREVLEKMERRFELIEEKLSTMDRELLRIDASGCGLVRMEPPGCDPQSHRKK